MSEPSDNVLEFAERPQAPSNVIPPAEQSLFRILLDQIRHNNAILAELHRQIHAQRGERLARYGAALEGLYDPKKRAPHPPHLRLIRGGKS